MLAVRKLDIRGRSFWAGATRTAIVPTGVACAGAVPLAGSLAALGLTGVSVVLHGLLAFVAPLNVLIISAGFLRHRKPLALLVAGVGFLFLAVHGATHFEPVSDTLTAGIGVGLLIAATALDWREVRLARQRTANASEAPAPTSGSGFPR